MKSTKPKKLTATAVQKDSVYAEFPSARYFQVHYEHIHAELLETRRGMAELQQQMAELQNYLELTFRTHTPPEQAVNRLKSIAKNDIGESILGNE